MQIEISNKTEGDEELKMLKETIMAGWPEEISNVHTTIKKYWNFRDQLSVVRGLIFNGQKVIIPKILIPKMLKIIHEDHHGIEKSKRMDFRSEISTI